MKKTTSTPNSEIKELINNLEERLKKHLKWEFMVAESSMRRDWANDIKKEAASKFEEQSEELTAIKLEIMGELEKIRNEQIVLSSQPTPNSPTPPFSLEIGHSPLPLLPKK